MSEIAVDSCVVAKWLVQEPDSAKAQLLISHASADGHELIALDLVFPEVANVIWKRFRQKKISLEEAKQLIQKLRLLPIRTLPAASFIDAAFDIAAKYDRSVYDALFVALTAVKGCQGITSDEPLVHSTQQAFPQIRLLGNY